jgi:hypothetical protein
VQFREGVPACTGITPEKIFMSMVVMTKIGDDIFVLLDDMKITKRGKDGTPQADSWVVLEPGFSVVDSADLTKLVIEFGGEVLVLSYDEAYRHRDEKRHSRSRGRGAAAG